MARPKAVQVPDRPDAADSANSESDPRGDDLVAVRHATRAVDFIRFQQADITNILRLIAEVSGFNIVVVRESKPRLP